MPIRQVVSSSFSALSTPAICLGLDLGQLQVVDDDRLLVLELAEDGHARRGPDGLLGQVVLVVARLRALGGAAAAALVGAAGADAGVAGALLAEQLLGAAGHLAAAQRRVGAGPLVGQVHQHDVVQQLLLILPPNSAGSTSTVPTVCALAVEDRQADRGRRLSLAVATASNPFTSVGRRLPQSGCRSRSRVGLDANVPETSSQSTNPAGLGVRGSAAEADLAFAAGRSALALPPTGRGS